MKNTVTAIAVLAWIDSFSFAYIAANIRPIEPITCMDGQTLVGVSTRYIIETIQVSMLSRSKLSGLSEWQLGYIRKAAKDMIAPTMKNCIIFLNTSLSFRKR